jgi:hypothetical protein
MIMTLVEKQERVMNFFQLRGTTTKEEILRHNYANVSAQDLDTILLVLKRSGIIQELKDGKLEFML